MSSTSTLSSVIFTLKCKKIFTAKCVDSFLEREGPFAFLSVAQAEGSNRERREEGSKGGNMRRDSYEESFMESYGNLIW